MKRLRCLVPAGLFVVGVAFAQPSGMQAPVASNPKVEIKGKIERIQFSRGQGMPTLEVRTGDKTVSVVLGSMRYLMEQNFNPKAGEEVVAEGYQVTAGILATTVTLPATGKVLRLRDDAGRPVWIGGRRGAGWNRPTR